MEHPGVNIAQIKEDLSLDEIQGKLQQLNSRLSFSYSTGNQELINQLEMIIEVYRRAQFEMLEEMFGNDGPDTSDSIDIS